MLRQLNVPLQKEGQRKGRNEEMITSQNNQGEN